MHNPAPAVSLPQTNFMYASSVMVCHQHESYAFHPTANNNRRQICRRLIHWVSSRALGPLGG